MYIHEAKYRKIKYLKNQSKSFISWLCPLLKPFPFAQNQFIFLEGDDISQIYFLIQGKCSFVLPSFDNTAYIRIGVGDHFGIIDIVGSSAIKNFEIDKFMENKNFLQRQFTVIANNDNVDTLTLSLQDLHRLKQEFNECYETMLLNSHIRLRRTWMAKLLAMKKCQQQIQNFNLQQEKHI